MQKGLTESFHAADTLLTCKMSGQAHKIKQVINKTELCCNKIMLPPKETQNHMLGCKVSRLYHGA